MDEIPLCMGILIEEGTGADRLMTPVIEFVSIRIPMHNGVSSILISQFNSEILSMHFQEIFDNQKKSSS